MGCISVSQQNHVIQRDSQAEDVESYPILIGDSSGRDDVQQRKAAFGSPTKSLIKFPLSSNHVMFQSPYPPSVLTDP